MENEVGEAETLLREAAEAYPPAALASSLGAEDMVLLDMISRNGLGIEVFTLDTGQLPQETYDLLQRARQRYRVPIAVYAPVAADIEAYISAHGPNAFYDSVALRRECCRLRKVKPLQRALEGKRVWITGQRRAQSPTRADLPLREWDSANLLEKFNPLADWSDESLWNYIRRYEVPHNALHAKGYPTIGCAPCTRPIAPGEAIRAGRWWWENPEYRECGLHPRQASHG